MASWRRAFRLHLRGGTVEQDVDDEIAFHLEMRARAVIRTQRQLSLHRCFAERAVLRKMQLSGFPALCDSKQTLDIFAQLRVVKSSSSL